MSLKTAGIREFARMIGRSHSWVVSQCQRNIIPKTTDGKIPVDDALKIVAQLDEEKSREKEEREREASEAEGLLSFDEARAKKETYLAEIKEMEAKGYLRKTASEEDGRVTYITATEAGKLLSQRYSEHYFSLLAPQLADISDEDAACTIRTIERMHRVMSERRGRIDE